jgi:hypothetical protein
MEKRTMGGTSMNQWIPMTDEDWEWVNYGKLPTPPNK